MKSFALSSRGLYSATRMCADLDFTFHVGKHSYNVNRFFAGFLSPIISQMSLTDPFISSFNIDIDDSFYQFNNIIDLQNGEPITFSDYEYLILIGSKLGNDEIIDYGMSLKNQEEPLSIENVIERLKTKVLYNLDKTEEVNFIASNFCNMDQATMKTIEINTLEMIISSPFLRIDNEKSLFDFIESLILEHGQQYKQLLNCVHSENLNKEGMKRFLSLLEPKDINGPLWTSLCNRLLMDVHENQNESTENLEKNQKRMRETCIKPDPKNPMHGVLWVLTQKCGGNVHKKGIVNITSSTTDYNQPYDVANENWNDYWYSKEESFPWLCVDFKEISIKPTNYTLKTFNCGSGYSHIKSWVLEGSNDGISWTVLDAQTNCSLMNQKRATIIFNCNGEESFHKLRIKMTGRNHHNGTYMCLAGIEFFGTIKE